MKVTHFRINFSQYLNFHFTLHTTFHNEFWLWVKIAICCGIYKHMGLQNILFMTYFTIFRCFSDFMYVKVFKDYSLTWQGENSTYPERSAQCRTRQYFRITKKLLKKHRYTYIHKKGINTQLCTIVKTFPSSRYICTLKVWGEVRIYIHRQLRDWESGFKWMLLKEDYSAVFGVKESIATTNHLNMHLHICLIYGSGKQFSKLN